MLHLRRPLARISAPCLTEIATELTLFHTSYQPDMHRSSSNQWKQRQARDPYIAEAQSAGYRSRAAYKLAEIDHRKQLLRPGMTVVDLGAAPGSWSQYAAHKLGAQGRVIALDKRTIVPMMSENIKIIKGDFHEQDVLDALVKMVGISGADLVLSDMAPNISGVGSIDQPRAMLLAELALELADVVLKQGGDLVVKLFQGEGFDQYIRKCRTVFKSQQIVKPKASRAKSREVYLVGKGNLGIGDSLVHQCISLPKKL